MSQSGSQLIYTQTSSSSSPTCFSALIYDKTYQIRLPSPPSNLFSTTGGDSQFRTITVSNKNQTADFGYAAGALSLSVPSSISFNNLNVATTSQQATANISNIRVIDSRTNKPGWALSCIVNNFSGQLDNNVNIGISNNFHGSPQNLVPINGSGSNVTPGNQKTVTSTTDPISVMDSSANYGNGTYAIDVNSSFNVPAYIKAQNYQSSFICTVL